MSHNNTPIPTSPDRPSIVRVCAYNPDGTVTTLSVQRATFAGILAVARCDSGTLFAMLRAASARLAEAGAYVGGNWSHQVTGVVAREVGYTGPISARALRVKPRQEKPKKPARNGVHPSCNPSAINSASTDAERPERSAL